MNPTRALGRIAAPVLVAVVAIAGTGLAAAAETCYDFGRLAVGASWPIAPQTAVPIDIGTLRVHPLVLDGIVQTPKVARLVLADDAIAGGRAPELSAVAVAIQIEPAPGVRRIRLRYAEQPGVDDGRAVAVELNGLRRDWRGGFERLHGEHLGKAGHPARFTVTPESASEANGWQRGRLQVEMKNGSEIRSFTLGAALLRLDDMCFER
jgi:hypothetical protein